MACPAPRSAEAGRRVPGAGRAEACARAAGSLRARGPAAGRSRPARGRRRRPSMPLVAGRRNPHVRRRAVAGAGAL